MKTHIVIACSALLVLPSALLVQSLVTFSDTDDPNTARVEYFWDEQCNDYSMAVNCTSDRTTFGGLYGSHSARFANIGTNLLYWEIHSFEGEKHVVTNPAVLQCVSFSNGGFDAGVEAYVKFISQ